MQYSYKKICINAPFPTTQYGHIVQTYLVTEFKDNLYARVYAFKDDNTWLIHASCDLIDLHEDIRNKIQNKIRQHYNNNNINFIASVTHTHYANNPYDKRYEEFFINTILEGIFSMEYKVYDDIQVSYRRIHAAPCGKSRISGYETNLQFLSAISFYNNDNNFLNIIIHNCHPTTLEATSKFFSAEYPGILISKLEEEYKDTDFLFLQGAAGDFSSRFIRTGQEYKDMLIIADNIYKETINLLNQKETRKSFKLDYKEVKFEVKHDVMPIDLSKIRSDLTDRELQVIEYGKQIREDIIKQGNFIKQAIVSRIDFGAVKLVMSGNELFSDYMKNMNLDERMLVCFTNADWAYVTPIGFDYITYELFYDTWSLESKKELANLLETI